MTEQKLGGGITVEQPTEEKTQRVIACLNRPRPDRPEKLGVIVIHVGEVRRVIGMDIDRHR
ncbi:hypothetical protein D3C87_2086430 [compost metagenome]